MASLEAILGARNLTGVIQSTKTKVPRVLGDEWFKIGRQTFGVTAEFLTQPGQRTNARNTNYGSPAKSVNLRNISGVPTVLMHSFETVNMGATTLMNLLSPDGTDQGMRQKMGREEVVRQVTAFADRFDNLRTTFAQMQLFTNHLYFDKDGNILPTSTGSVFDAGPGIPTANTGHVTAGAYASSPLMVSWDTTTTDIITQLQKLQALAIQQTGFPLANAYYGANIPGYIGTNATAQQYLRYQLGMNAEYVKGGQVPQGFGGIAKWTPTLQAFFATEDAGGAETINTYSDPDTIIFTPDPDSTWYEGIEGSFPVPQSIDIKTSAELAADEFKETFGKFSFAKISHNPPGLEAYMGDTFSYQIRNPKVVYIVKVKGTT